MKEIARLEFRRFGNGWAMDAWTHKSWQGQLVRHHISSTVADTPELARKAGREQRKRGR